MNDNRFESDGSRRIDALIRPHNLVRLPLSGDVTRKAIEELGQEADPKRGRGNAKGRTSLNWNEMAPRQRDALIAEKIMGLTVEHWTQKELTITNEEGELETYDLRTGYVVIDGMGNPAVLHYTADMSSAWQVIEHVYGSKERSSLKIALKDTIGDDWDDILDGMTPETLCFAALRACEVLDAQSNLVTPDPS